MNKKQKKIIIGGIAAILVVVLVVVLILVFGGKSSEDTTSSSEDTTSSSDITAQVQNGKAPAQTILEAIKTEGTEVSVESFPKRVVRTIKNETGEKIEVREDIETGALNGIELSVDYTDATRDEKLVGFYNEIKRIMQACIPSMTDDRAQEIVNIFKQSLPELGSAATRTVNEGAYSFAVSYFPDRAYFVVS